MVSFFPQKTIESETVKTSEVIKKKLEEITGTVKEVKHSSGITFFLRDLISEVLCVFELSSCFS